MSWNEFSVETRIMSLLYEAKNKTVEEEHLYFEVTNGDSDEVEQALKALVTAGLIIFHPEGKKSFEAAPMLLDFASMVLLSHDD